MYTHIKMPCTTSETATAVKKKKKDELCVFQHQSNRMNAGRRHAVSQTIQEVSSTQIADKVDTFHSPFWGKYHITWCFTEEEKSY